MFSHEGRVGIIQGGGEDGTGDAICSQAEEELNKEQDTGWDMNMTSCGLVVLRMHRHQVKTSSGSCTAKISVSLS